VDADGSGEGDGGGEEERRGFERGVSRRPPPLFQLQWSNVEDTSESTHFVFVS
jgi:hypothetical protein